LSPQKNNKKKLKKIFKPPRRPSGGGETEFYFTLAFAREKPCLADTRVGFSFFASFFGVFDYFLLKKLKKIAKKPQKQVQLPGNE